MHLFNEIKFRIDIQSNLQIENFLDISFLSNNTCNNHLRNHTTHFA